MRSRLGPFLSLLLMLVIGDSVRRCAAAAAATSSDIAAEYRGLQPACQAEVKKLMTSSSTIGACTGVGQLVTDVIADGDTGSQSILGPVGSWLSNACSMAPCTKGAVSQAVAAIKKGCKSDLSQKHYLAVVVLAVLENYTTTRTVACQKQKGEKTYCIYNVLQDMQKNSGKTWIPSFFSAIAAQPMAFVKSLKGTTWCSECLNEVVVQSKAILESVDEQCAADVDTLLVDKCKTKYDPDRKAGKDMQSATGSEALSYAGSGAERAYELSLLAFAPGLFAYSILLIP